MKEQQVKTQEQRKITDTIHRHYGHGIIAVATGVGKTKTAIDYLRETDLQNILWVVPTEKLRDVGVPNEFHKWSADKIFEKVTTICYKSLPKLSGEQYDLVIMDEGHNITPLNAEFFDRNDVDNILVLTATVPHEREKLRLLKKLNLNVIYKLDVNEAKRKGLVSDYRIVIITTPLDRMTKNIKAGNKEKTFFVTESQQYDFLTKRIEDKLDRGSKPSKFDYLNRMRCIHNLPSKLKSAKRLLELIPDSKRVLVFCSNIKQAESLNMHTYHSKSTKEGYDLFNQKKINRLAIVNALNEGHNMVDVDVAVMIQVNSNSRHYIQRQGRAIRWRPGHKAAIYILSTAGTVDEKWVTMSIENLSVNIKHKKSTDLWPKK